jgi:hypothetical protein
MVTSFDDKNPFTPSHHLSLYILCFPHNFRGHIGLDVAPEKMALDGWKLFVP